MGLFIYLCPLCCIDLIVRTLALVTISLLPKRREVAIRNITASFPGMHGDDARKLATVSLARTIEQGFLAIAWPHLSRKRITALFTISEESLSLLSASIKSGSGVLWMVPHFCHADVLSFLPNYMGEKHGVHALYRPLKNPVLNNFIKKSRERFGLTTIDRKDGGMLKTLKVLKRAKTLALLFDQNAGAAGTRLEFMGRECSCTTLPDILYNKYKPQVLFVYTRRTSFWESNIVVEKLKDFKRDELLIENANQWLQNKLRSDKVLCESWLWTHQRWKQGSGQHRKGKVR